MIKALVGCGLLTWIVTWTMAFSIGYADGGAVFALSMPPAMLVVSYCLIWGTIAREADSDSRIGTAMCVLGPLMVAIMVGGAYLTFWISTFLAVYRGPLPQARSAEMQAMLSPSVVWADLEPSSYEVLTKYRVRVRFKSGKQKGKTHYAMAPLVPACPPPGCSGVRTVALWVVGCPTSSCQARVPAITGMTNHLNLGRRDIHTFVPTSNRFGRGISAATAKFDNMTVAATDMAVFELTDLTRVRRQLALVGFLVPGILPILAFGCCWRIWKAASDPEPEF
ncbi:uncharacterized protein AMSG_04520 [Thecamonas trahens ATCC 50062]|uniref:Uncharacterized protein n=1 Tax=Thecamonas trahens ATCC 50062 TaxID=461836 RepID=A0A0L0D7V9_THETB|nr:hypothetical protein AMSG_04520 [Thecamonas trahens ATCC 50062]KNC48290.1 hypothetical protein AMSG_04520 [Thecamonas trahens ATCC 50062]|eukprot:XP_013758857.1 hypothetical protein AMSG_04520 [Thecamonas trahens ATCC 50062]